MLACFSHYKTQLLLSFNRLVVEVKVKNLEVVLSLHCSVHFVQCISTSGTKTSPEHDAAITMLDTWDIVLRFESLNFTRPNIPLVYVL